MGATRSPYKHTHIHTYTHTYKHTNIQTDGRTDRQIDIPVRTASTHTPVHVTYILYIYIHTRLHRHSYCKSNTCGDLVVCLMSNCWSSSGGSQTPRKLCTNPSCNTSTISNEHCTKATIPVFGASEHNLI